MFLIFLMPGVYSSFSFVKRSPKLLSKATGQVYKINRTQNDVQTVAITAQFQNIFE